jgi:hypothetical protein
MGALHSVALEMRSLMMLGVAIEETCGAVEDT